MVSLLDNSERRQAGFLKLASGIEQCPRTAVTRIPKDLACPARTQVHRHLMMLSVVDRPAGDHRADVIVYSTVDADDGDDGFFYVETFDVKHAAGELRSKPLGYDVSAECEAEQQAAQQLLRRDRKWGEQAL